MGSAISQSSDVSGLGNSKVTCIDRDGDTYGVGPGCTGVDADDTDAAVHTASEAVARWGSMQAFLGHRGYKADRYWVISPNGDDATCKPFSLTVAPDPGAASPCKTFAQIQTSILPGDTVFWRGGTYPERINAFLAASGTSSAPIVYIAYPGEKVTISNARPVDACTGAAHLDYIAIDGFFLTAPTPGGGDDGVNVCFNTGLTIRNNEVRWTTRGLFGAQDLNNVLVEYNVVHDTNGPSGTHTLYFGAREYPNANITIAHNIFYNPGTTCLQHNGRVSNLIIDGNICYNVTNASGISLEQGVHDSAVRNNVVFNTEVKPFVMFDYPEQSCVGAPTIKPYDQTNNLIENNTFVVPAKKLDGTTLGTTPNILISANVPIGTTVDLGHNTFRNNLLINHSGGDPIYVTTASSTCGCYDGLGCTGSDYSTAGAIDPAAFANTLAWTNNDIWTLGSTGNAMWLYNTYPTQGTPPQTQAAISKEYDWASWNIFNGATTGNISTDPFFVAYDDSWYNAPERYDFRLQATSAGLNSGTATGATVDVLGMVRSGTSSLGAYQYAAGGTQNAAGGTQNAAGGTQIPLNTWVMVPTHGIPASAVGWEKLVYAGAAKKAIFLGTYHEPSSEPNQALLAYDFEANRWDILDTGGLFHEENMPEAGHPAGSFAYDEANGVIAYYCCASGSNQYENVWHTWWFDPIGQVGRDKQTSPKPKMAYDFQQTGSYIAANRTFVVFNAGVTYSYDPAKNTWTDLHPNGTPPPAGVSSTSMDYDSRNGKLYAFGGQTVYGPPSQYENDVYSYDVTSNTWTKLVPAGQAPSPRMKAGWSYDSTNNVFLLFGGENDSIVNDTWVFDPAANGQQGAWTQLSPAKSPPVGSSAPFERMVYDRDHNAFVLVISGEGGYADGTYNQYPIQTWIFRLAGAGPNPGTTTASYSAHPGINRNVTGWAREPFLAASGDKLIAAWSEAGVPFDNVSSQWQHIYANVWANGQWTQLGSSYSSINSERAGDVEAHSPAVTLISGTPWVSYYGGLPPQAPPQVFAKSWNGSQWAGGPVGLVHNAPGVTQSRSEVVGVGATPYVAFIEVDKSNAAITQQHYVFVKHFDGSSWVSDGIALNRDSGRYQGTPYSIATSVSMASDGGSAWVAWTEYTTNNNGSDTTGQVYVSKGNGTGWDTVGGSLNVDSAQLAADVTIAYLDGQPYVGWTERSSSGNNLFFVKTFNGSTWVSVGALPLNRNTVSGWVFRPRLVADAGTHAVYAGWVEQQSIGIHPQAYVSRYSNGSWTALGDSLNADSNSGAAQRVSLAIVGAQPVAAWGEVTFGSFRQIVTKRWDGVQWVPLAP